MAYLELVVVVAMVGVNATFAAYEIALASVSVARLQSLADQKRKGASAALAMKEGIEKSLAALQLGITLVGLIAGATGGVSASEYIAPHLERFGLSEGVADFVAIVSIVAPLTALTIIAGELMPKLFALRNKEWVCLKLSPHMKVFALTTWPIVWFLDFSASGLIKLIELAWHPIAHKSSRTEAVELQELRAVASMARAARLIGPREENIILGAAKLSMRALREIIMPAEQIRMFALDDVLQGSLLADQAELHTRFPVARIGNDPQSIVGYVTFKDIATHSKMPLAERTMREILREIPSLQADMPISIALEHLLQEHTHIAIVRDRTDKVVGMITLEDILEELLGDMRDEHGVLPRHIIRLGNGWIVGGGATLGKIRETTQIDLGGAAATTNLNTWVHAYLGMPPRGGETIHNEHARILIRKVRRRRVLEAGLERT